MSEKIKTVLSSVLAISLVVSVMTVSGYACFVGAKMMIFLQFNIQPLKIDIP